DQEFESTRLQTRDYFLHRALYTSMQKHKDSTSGKQCDLGDKYWSDQDGELFFKYMGSTNPSANKDAVNDLVDALDDLVDENSVVEVDKNLSQDDFLKAKKLEAKKIGWRSGRD
nr:hypothetical protein [Tanacetum cinerariifolium]